MHLLVVGSTGRTGRHVVGQALAKGYRVRAMLRRSQGVAGTQLLGAEAMFGDLTGDFSQALEGQSVVVCAAGAGAGGNPDQVDFLGTVRLIEAAQKAGVQRFVLISSMGTLYPEAMPAMLRPYLLAKRKAEQVLQQSHMLYTIVRPGGLSDQAGTGHVRIALALPSPGMVFRQDLASVVIECLERPNTFGKAFDVISGPNPIAEAVQSL